MGCFKVAIEGDVEVWLEGPGYKAALRAPVRLEWSGAVPIDIIFGEEVAATEQRLFSSLLIDESEKAEEIG